VITRFFLLNVEFSYAKGDEVVELKMRSLMMITLMFMSMRRLIMNDDDDKIKSKTFSDYWMLMLSGEADGQLIITS